MIKAFQLIFAPAVTWDRIAQAERGLLSTLFINLLPLIIAACLIEGYGLYRLGDKLGLYGAIISVRPEMILTYELIQAGTYLLAAFLGARIIKSVAESFNSRAQYRHCFVVVAYSLTPLILLQIVDGIPQANTWVCRGIGMLLMVSTLYYGLPRLLKPDSVRALSLYFVSSLLLAGLTGVGHFIAVSTLRGNVIQFGQL
jgi:ABC-type amino acid transport system permease subunit